MSRAFSLFLIFCIGCLALIYEIYSMRVLFMFYVESTKAASIAISSFLGGLAFSSIIFSAIGHKKSEKQIWSLIFWMQLASAVYAYFILRNYGIIPTSIDYVTQSFSDGHIKDALRFFMIWFFLFVPAFFFGGAFPLINGLYVASREKVGHDTGVVYFWDTLGAICGALVAGFVLLPHLGVPTTIMIAIVANLVICALLPTFRYVALLIPLVIVLEIIKFGGVSAMISPQKTGHVDSSFYDPIEKWVGGKVDNNAEMVEQIEKKLFKNSVIFRKESPFGTVTVHDAGAHNYQLFINFRSMCETGNPNIGTEKLLADISMDNLTDEPLVMNIGLGCGLTAKQVLRRGVAHLDIIEINPIVMEANRDLFDTNEPYLFNNAKVNIFNEDGAVTLRTSNKLYDSIIIDIEEVSVIHSAPFYTREYFEIIKDRLREGGVFALWSFDVAEHPEFARIMYNTAKAVFPYAYFRVKDNALTIYASEKPLKIRPVTDEGEQALIDKIMSTNMDLINTMDHPVLEKYYDINAVFHLPAIYRDPYVHYGESEKRAREKRK